MLTFNSIRLPSTTRVISAAERDGTAAGDGHTGAQGRARYAGLHPPKRSSAAREKAANHGGHGEDGGGMTMPRVWASSEINFGSFVYFVVDVQL